jgi:hypothetical protein
MHAARAPAAVWCSCRLKGFIFISIWGYFGLSRRLHFSPKIAKGALIA